MYNKKFADDYIKTTVNELNKIDRKVNSIYIGGGSPSSLDEKQLEVLLQNAKRLFLSPDWNMSATVRQSLAVFSSEAGQKFLNEFANSSDADEY